MFITYLLNRRWTSRARLLASMGLPEVRTSYRDGTYYPQGSKRGVDLSRHAAEEWNRFTQEKVTVFLCPNYEYRDVYGKDNMIIGMAIVSCALFVVGCIFTPASGFLWTAVSAFIFASLPNEIWSLFALSKLKMITEYTKDEVRTAAWQIIDDNQRDLDLETETKLLISEYQHKLSANQITCSDTTRIEPQGDDGWRMVDVQFHNIGDSPLDRDVTLTMSSDGQDGITCVLPGQDAIVGWLETQLVTMREQVKEHTHTFYMLKSVRAVNILKDVWQPPSQVLSEVAKMVTSSKQPFTERARVTVHGTALKSGHIMLQAIGFKEKGEQGLMFAPTEPIVQLSAVVAEHLRLKGSHPALLADMRTAA